jgi:Holliday junction resolvase-like predicted endonuclease
MMTDDRERIELLRRRWASGSGELELIGSQLELLTAIVGKLRDSGAPEDVLEDLTRAIGSLRDARHAAISASRRLWLRVEDMP